MSIFSRSISLCQEKSHKSESVKRFPNSPCNSRASCKPLICNDLRPLNLARFLLGEQRPAAQSSDFPTLIIHWITTLYTLSQANRSIGQLIQSSVLLAWLLHVRKYLTLKNSTCTSVFLTNLAWLLSSILRGRNYGIGDPIFSCQ